MDFTTGGHLIAVAVLPADDRMGGIGVFGVIQLSDFDAPDAVAGHFAIKDFIRNGQLNATACRNVAGMAGKESRGADFIEANGVICGYGINLQRRRRLARALVIQRQGFRHLCDARLMAERSQQRDLSFRQRLHILLRHADGPAAVFGGGGVILMAVQRYRDLIPFADIAAPAGNQQIAAAFDGAQHIVAGHLVKKQRRH